MNVGTKIMNLFQGDLMISGSKWTYFPEEHGLFDGDFINSGSVAHLTKIMDLFDSDLMIVGWKRMFFAMDLFDGDLMISESKWTFYKDNAFPHGDLVISGSKLSFYEGPMHGPMLILFWFLSVLVCGMIQLDLLLLIFICKPHFRKYLNFKFILKFIFAKVLINYEEISISSHVRNWKFPTICVTWLKRTL